MKLPKLLVPPNVLSPHNINASEPTFMKLESHSTKKPNTIQI